MRVIFAKTTDDRCKRFQIYTKIVEESGVRSVIKGSVYPDGREHIEKIYKNYLSLKSFRSAFFHIVPCELKDGEVIFPYVKGKQLSACFFEAARDGNREAFTDLLRQYIRLITICEENKTVFDETEKFRDVFGKVSGLEDRPAFRVSNIDSDVDNIVFLNGEMSIYDYEWVYDFPIPADFVLYRNLQYLYHFDIVKNKAPVPFDQACCLAKISLPTAVLEQMNLSFSHMVNFEPKQREDVLFMKRRYLKGVLIRPADDRNESGCVQTQKQFVVYVKEKQDGGFSEEKAIRFTIEPLSVDLTVDLTPFSGLESVRIDPMECPCVLTDVRIALDGSPFDPSKIICGNGKKFGNGKYYFTDNDPQILLGEKLNGTKKLRFRCGVERCDDPFIRTEYGLLDEAERREAEIAELHGNLDRSEKEKKDLTAELGFLQEEFDTVSAVKNEQDDMLYDIYHSRAWKLITRFREIKHKLRRE